ncbi:MAG: protease modulator HflC [Chakrabartia sp.]
MERLIRNPFGIAFVALGALILLSATISFVPETRQGVIVQFGQPVRIINAYKAGVPFGSTGAGIMVRLPFVEQVQWLDKRVQSIDMDEQEVLSTDQLRLQVDGYARYRIVDPLKMYKTARTEERLTEALRPLLGSSLRNELGKQTFAALLSPERGAVMNNIKTGLNRAANQYGAEIIDVRIMRADLPKGTPLESAFDRMRSARKQEADTKRAEAWKNAQIIRANADAEASKTYAASFGKDPSFYDFYRAMQSYKRTFGTDGSKPEGSTNIILSPGNDYLREFRGRP